MFPPVLGAVDVSQIIGISVLVITVLSWFVNVIQGNTPDGAPRQQKPKQTARNEIENLLQELSGDKRKPKAEQREQQARPARPPAERAKPKPKPQQQRPGGPPPYTPSRSTSRPTDAKLPSANLGGGVRSHHLANQIDAGVKQEITTPVQHDLGNPIAAAAPVQERPVHPLVKVLRDPNGVRQAILLNEILQRPKSARG